MSTTTTTTGTSQRTAVTVQIDRHHVEQLRALAGRDASTVSRNVARLGEEKFDENRGTKNGHDAR